MYRARSLASAIVATLATAAALAGVAWFGAVLAARGTSQAVLPTLLTTNNFAALEWPYRADRPPVEVHVAFYVATAVVALVAGFVTLLIARKASPRNGAAALAGTWLGVVVGSVLAAVALFYLRVDALAPTVADRNDVLVSLVRDFSFGGVLLGVGPAALSWATFKLANRKRALELREAMDLAEGRNIEENPFDLAPGSNGETRPVEPGFTYPAGDTYTDGSYRDVDLPPSERRTGTMTFSDVTDATGEDFAERDADYRPDRSGSRTERERADLSFAAPSQAYDDGHPAPTLSDDQADEHTSRHAADAPDAPRDASDQQELRKTGT